MNYGPDDGMHDNRILFAASGGGVEQYPKSPTARPVKFEESLDDIDARQVGPSSHFMYLLLPLIAAVAFAFGSMVFKRAFEEGAGLVHAVVVNNVALGILFLPLLWLEPGPVPLANWHMPVLTALAFVVGHLLNVLSLRIGDVSVATPLLGSKVIFVAVVGWLVFGTRFNAAQWAAAALATAGVAVMGLTDFRAGGRMGLTTVTALGCAAAFALTDTMIQAWGGAFGVWSFLALQFAALAVLSLTILPFFGPASFRAPRKAWKWIA
ncbi:MAG: DMT family transporter, partial [Verrucomicrobiales bacterium]|nr:DMT family transporter [Verrucomicrobiales bacterium]